MKREQLEQMLAKASKSVQRLNADLARICPRTDDKSSEVPSLSAITKPKKRIRNARPKQSKLELEAFEWLKGTHPGYDLRLQPYGITLTLANGCKYTPDICGMAPTGHVHFWEVKGRHVWEDAIVKIKVAAAFWPAFGFTLMWQDDGWNFQDVYP